MKAVIILFFLFFVGCNERKTKTSEASLLENSYLIKIEKMGCRSCVRKIKKYLYEKEGIQAVIANIPERTLTFKLSEQNYHSRAYLKSLSQDAITGKWREHSCRICSNKKSE